MSRVLSRRRPGRFLLRLRFGFVGGCGPSLGNERYSNRVSLSGSSPAPQESSRSAPARAGLLSITVEPNATARTARTTKTARKWALAPLPANAQLRLPVSAFLALFLQTWRLLELPCSGHASLCRWLRAWQPGTSRPWQPRPSKGASEAAEGLPQPMRGLPLNRTTLKARYDSGELVRGSSPADAKRQRVDDSTPAETAKFLRMLKTREQIRLAKAAGAP